MPQSLMDKDNLLQESPKLNPEQNEAVTTLNGPLLVLAGAGSGKTRVVTHRIVHLLQSGISASAILGLTFTNKAAQEMKERVHSLTNAYVWISTFHSLGARILRESIHHLGYTSRFTIYDEEDSLRLLRNCMQEIFQKKTVMEPKRVRGIISRGKNDLIDPEKLSLPSSQNPLGDDLYRLIALYQKRLFDANALDFDDLLYLTNRLFSEHPTVLMHYQQQWRYLLIDEYQDTNAAQYQMVQKLVASTHNLCVVGDPDQSIYSWRGANIHNILDFAKTYPEAKIIRLEQNYRSRSTILEASNALIAHNAERYEKKLWSDRGEGEKIEILLTDDEMTEAQSVIDRVEMLHEHHAIPLSDMVIFYRTNAQSRPFEDILLSRGVPYRVVGGLSFYQRKEVKDILSFIRMSISDSDLISFMRTINIPKRGIGNATIEKLRNAADSEAIPLFSYCDRLTHGGQLHHHLKLTKKQMEALTSYVDTLLTLRHLSQELSISAIVEQTIQRTAYVTHLNDDPLSAEDRKENLDALIGSAKEWEMVHPNGSLSAFLEELSLKTTLDEGTNTQDSLSLMTIHNGKGLEFHATFLVGMEEGLFPHINTKGEREQIEEERRLCYVGMTRAKEYLFLSYARFRFLWGTKRRMTPSPFLHEIPEEYVKHVQQRRRWNLY